MRCGVELLIVVSGWTAIGIVVRQLADAAERCKMAVLARGAALSRRNLGIDRGRTLRKRCGNAFQLYCPTCGVLIEGELFEG
jgi:hypothetical protein